MTAEQFGNVIISLVSLIALWGLYAFAYQDYRRDVYRQKLFHLRCELFDMAVAGEISFDDPAYGTLRSTLNGFIRFAHKMRFLPVALFVAFESKEARDETSPTFTAIWNRDLYPLDPKVQARLSGILVRAHICALEQLVVTSALLFPLAPLAYLILLLKKKGTALARPYWMLRERVRSSWIDAFDHAALQEGSAVA